MQRETRLVLDRRRFVQSAIQGAAALTAIALPARPAAARAAAMRFHRVIFDSDFRQSRLFGVRAESLGALMHGIRGDVTDFWYDDLYHRWRLSPAPIAGMTGFKSLFVLEMMAADVGMRIIYRAHHCPLRDGSTSHSVFGPARQVSEIKLSRSEDAWTRAVAKTVMSWPAETLTISKAHSNIADARLTAVGPETLISWIIASPGRG
jgi:hypothetical protein